MTSAMERIDKGPELLPVRPEALVLLSELDGFRGRWEALGTLAPQRLMALRRVATIESVASSTRIEGAKLTDQEVDRLLSGKGRRALTSRDAQEVAGYADAMDLVFEAWSDLRLTENHVKQLHGVLLKHSQKDGRHRGHYKKVPNHLEAFDEDGRSLGVILETASPFETPGLMETLVRRTAAALETKSHHPLVVIAWFTVQFLAIHPFQDGNGRLSRVLTTLLLLRAGYSYVPFSSLERVIEESKERYYRTLRHAQGKKPSAKALGDWLLFFLRALVEQKNTLEWKVEQERMMASQSVLDEKLLKLVRDHGRLTVAAAVRLTQANRNTVKLHLRQLVHAGKLRLLGKGRGAWYDVA